MAPRHGGIITFKAHESLERAMKGIPNRSEFIRTAILRALDNLCPLCRGAGVLTDDQRRHWDAIAARHPLEKCGDCHAFHLVCEDEGDRPVLH